jgi:hypothetical protein
MDAIALVYEGLAATPERVLQDYERFPEATLVEGLSERARRIGEGAIVIDVGISERETVLGAARLLRALEESVHEVSHYLETDRGEELEALWRTTDGRHYVIPRVTPLVAIDGKPFLRRALLHYRVLPTSIDTFEVRLHRSTIAADAFVAAEEREGRTRNFGAALFPGLQIAVTSPDIDSFTVTGLSGFDADAQILDHLRQGREAACGAIVWGELTMPEASVAFLSKRLRAEALDGHHAYRYLVAGSWHREVGGHMRNVAQVLDGYGEPLFGVFKWAKFKIGSQQEAIEPGEEIHVLICEDEVMVVAICRDFLQSTTDVPYRKLNADIAIVPSMIARIQDVATLRGHAATADVMRVRFGTRTLAVAQPATPEGRIVGKVLAFPARPIASDGESVEGPWRLCPLDTP